MGKLHIILYSICICSITCLSSCYKKTDSEAEAKIMACKNVYNKALAAQHNGSLDEARQLYERCLEFDADDNSTSDSLQLIMSNAITQTLNIYQVEGKPKECIDWLVSLNKAKSHIIREKCRRNIAVSLAYAMSRTESVDSAAKVMDKALKIPLSQSTPDELFRDYSYATAVYFCVPQRKTDIEKYGHMALELIPKCKNKSGAIWVNAIMGLHYKRNGNIKDAVNLFRKCYDDANASADTLGMANASYLTADMMLYWDLAAYANDYANRAVKLIEESKSKLNPMVCSNILTCKAQVMLNLGREDSALLYTDKASNYTKNLPYNSGNSDIELIRGRVYAHNAATRDKGIEILSKVARLATPGIKARAYFSIAKAFFANGNDKEGGIALDSSLTLMSRYASPVLANSAYEYAFNHYVATGNDMMTLRIAREFNNMSIDKSNSSMLKQVAENVAEFKTEKQAEELRSERLKLDEQRRMLLLYSIVMAAFIVVISITFVIKRRYNKLQHRLAQQKLQNLTIQMESMAREQKILEEKLKEHNHDSTDKVKSMTPTTINIGKIQDKTCEQQFRNTFGQVYPEFMESLHKRVPDITRREEILAMLIAIGLDNNRIEEILCIAHNSVNMARYRLRLKMHLDRDANLEDEIASLM